MSTADRVSPDEMRPLGATELRMPVFGFGGAPLGNLFSEVPEDQAEATLQAAWDCGVRYFDTAPWYGHGLSEHRIGRLLRRQEANSWWCSTKVGRVYTPVLDPATRAPDTPWVGGLPFTPRFDYSYAGIMRSYEDSLQRLGVNRVDAVVIHDLDLPHHKSDTAVTRNLRQLEDGWKALAELKLGGQIQAIGVGINDRAMMTPFLENFPPDFFLVAMPYTLLDHDILEAELPYCEKQRIGIIVGAPYASGILAAGASEGVRYNYTPASSQVLRRVAKIEEVCKRHGVPLAAAALQFPLQNPNVTSVIPGANTAQQVRENHALLRRQVPVDLWRELKCEGLIRQDAPGPD